MRLVGLVLPIALGAVSYAGAQQPVTRRQLNGEWVGTLVLDNSSPRLALAFQLTDSTFGGRVYGDGDLVGEMQGGSLVGNRVHFKVDQLDFTGRIEGATMKIDLIVINGSTRTFTARKTADWPRDSTVKHPPS